MLFTTAAFVLLFLPVVLTGFFLIGRSTQTGAAAWLFFSSLFFYGYWLPVFTILLIASIISNFLFGRWIATALASAPSDARGRARLWLVFGLTFNLGLLGYFKYANFFVDNLNLALGGDWSIGRVILPIGISFYTFTQIAFLVDASSGKVNETQLHPLRAVRHLLPAPHRRAGPASLANDAAVRRPGHLPLRCRQLRRWGGDLRPRPGQEGAAGRRHQPVRRRGVQAADAGSRRTPSKPGSAPSPTRSSSTSTSPATRTWRSDCPGCSTSACRSTSTRRTSRRASSISGAAGTFHCRHFLRDYLYIALGGNRRGSSQRYVNLMVTMLLGGLWHGASWTFVIWGGLHGLYLMVDHGFRAAVGARRIARLDRSRLFGLFGWALTMLSVIFAWVFFRAESFSGCLRVLRGMAGLQETGTVHPLLWNAGLHGSAGVLWCLALGGLAFLAPNSNRVGAGLLTWLRQRPGWRDFVGGVSVCAILMLVLINSARDSVSAFIYFNF